MMAAFVFVQAEGTRNWEEMGALHMALHAVSGVKTVHFVAGPTDIILFVEAADMAALGQIVGKLRGVKGVASTDTRLVLPI